MNPFVFIVGCARSGTTLLQRIVDAHPRIAILRRETHWIPDYFRDGIGLTLDGSATPELVGALIDHRTFPRLGISREDLEGLIGNGQAVPYARFVSGVFDLYGRKQDKPLVGDKTPAYCREIRLLHLLWPEAKFVHLIRDGRDVCLSAINWEKAPRLASLFSTWAEDPVTTAALWWEWHVRLGREGEQLLGPGLYYEMRYEALVAQPAEECAKLCAFLGVPYHEAMLRFYEGHEKKKPRPDAKHSWRPITAGLRDWQSQMPSEDVQHFEAVAGDLLEALGYPLVGPYPSVEMLQRVCRIRELFTQDALYQKSSLSED